MSLKAGKKTKEWLKAKRQLIAQLEDHGITSCEIRRDRCLKSWALTLAHARKRRFLHEGELKVVVVACSQCHNEIEAMPHEEMHRIVMDAIKRRKKQPVEIPESAWNHP